MLYIIMGFKFEKLILNCFKDTQNLQLLPSSFTVSNYTTIKILYWLYTVHIFS